jgi:hypothetical protein
MIIWEVMILMASTVTNAIVVLEKSLCYAQMATSNGYAEPGTNNHVIASLTSRDALIVTLGRRR